MTILVVSDTSPLISLQHIGKIELLRELYKELVVPSAVIKELGSQFPSQQWILERTISLPTDPLVLQAGLGAGETEAILLAIEIKSSLLLLDDGPARRLALSVRLPVAGTLAVLLQAKDRGLVRTIKPHLDQLILSGFRLSESLRELILRKAGEL